MDSWAEPERFKIFVWVALLTGAWLFAELFKTLALRSFSERAFLKEAAHSLSRFKRWVRILCFLAALVFLVLALARPQAQGKKVMVRHEGIDIVIAMDVSDSMLARDIRPNRLEKAKLELQDLVELAKGDRLGVVAFAGEAYIQVPLTIDRSAVKLFVRSLSPGMIPVPGTSLTRAIAVARSVFASSEKGEKAILLLTDGEDLESDALAEARKAAEQGVRIYTVGIGTLEGETIQMQTPGGSALKRDLSGKVVVSKLDEKTLQKIAEITGGTYYRSSRGVLEVEKIYRAILGLERKETGSGWIVEYDPKYQPYGLAAVILLLIQWALSERKRQ